MDILITKLLSITKRVEFSGEVKTAINDGAKMADQGGSDLNIVFTRILCGVNFCTCLSIKLIFTGDLQIVSLSSNF